MADRVYCLLEGRIVAERHAERVTKEQITDAYFGLPRLTAGGERR